MIRQRDDIAGALGVAKDAVRIVSGDVGGNFGIRNNTCPEFVLVAWAAKRVGRPVKWVCDRSDAFLGDFHGRDLTSEAELALDRDGSFLALRATNISNLGASAISFVPLAKGIAVSSSVYHIPVSYLRGVAVVTNTTPSSAYRSAGRPEVVFVLERLIDIACRRHGFDRLDLRLRNLVPQEAMPYRNPLGLVYDSGDYPASLRRAAELGDWAGFAARRAEAKARGRCRGIGVAASVELNTGAPRERAELTIDPAGTVELVLGTMSAGQGHETSFAQIVGEWLGVDPERVRLVTGDTDRVQAGGGSAFGALDAARLLGDRPRPPTRSSRKAGGSPPPCSKSPKPISNSSGGRFVVTGTDRAIGLFEAAEAAASDAVPTELRGPLVGISDQVMASRPSPIPARSARSRSIRRPAWSRSSVIRRSTIAAGR